VPRKGTEGAPPNSPIAAWVPLSSALPADDGGVHHRVPTMIETAARGIALPVFAVNGDEQP